MNTDHAVQALGAMAHPLRLAIFKALVQAGPQGQTPGAMHHTLQTPPATLSFHLKELMHAELVSQERQGRHLVYRANLVRMQGLLDYLLDNCCQGQPCSASAYTQSHES